MSPDQAVGALMVALGGGWVLARTAVLIGGWIADRLAGDPFDETNPCGCYACEQRWSAVDDLAARRSQR